jgi:hypothetical protein
MTAPLEIEAKKGSGLWPTISWRSKPLTGRIFIAPHFINNPVTFGAWFCLLLGILGFNASISQALDFHKYEPPPLTEVAGSCPDVQVTGPLRSVSAMTFFGEDLYISESLENQVSGFEYRTTQFSWSSGSLAPTCVSQLPKQNFNDLNDGIAFGTATGETEMYIGAQESSSPKNGVVAVFSLGQCGNFECAVLQKELTGTPLGSFGPTINDVAVDNSKDSKAEDWAKGDLFVATGGSLVARAVDVFEPGPKGSATYKTAIEGFLEPVERVAVSGFNGDVIVDVGSSTVDLFKPEANETYSLLKSLKLPSGSLKEMEDVAVDGSNGDIYVATDTAVYEFEANGDYSGQLTGVPPQSEEPERPFSFGSYRPRSLTVGVDPISHSSRIFVGVLEQSQESAVVDAFGPDIVVPDVKNGPVTNISFEPSTKSWNLNFNGEIRPDEGGEASCSFVWGPTKSFGNSTPCSGNVPNGKDFVSVKASVDGLRPDTTYYYRIKASNINGVNPGEEFEDREFTTPGPGLLSESVSEVSSSSVRLEASIDPHDVPVKDREQELQELVNSETTYYFQYSPTDTEGCDAGPVQCVSIPAEPVNLGSRVSVVKVSQRALDLQPNTTYHYRVVASNEGLPESDPGFLTSFASSDGVFVTQGTSSGSLVLPDDRKYELVSPIDKHGGVISPIGESGVIQSAAEGGAFTYLSSLPTEAEPQGYGDLTQIYSARGRGGWTSTDIGLSHEAPVGPLIGQGHEYRFFSEDLSLGVTESFGPFSPPVIKGKLSESFPPATERTPYLRHDASCASELMTCFTPLVTGALGYADVPEGTVFDSSPAGLVGTTKFVGATPDLSHVVISSGTGLTSMPAPNGGLYEWSMTNPISERIAPVSVLPAAEGGKIVEAGLGNYSGTTRVAKNMISDDGSRIFFTADGPNGEHLYMRDASRGETLRLDLPEGTLQEPGSGTGLFQTATTDGSAAFFTARARLTSDSGATGSQADLYRCEIRLVNEGKQERLTCRLSDLTPTGAHSEGAGVQGAVLASENGDYVYFVANAALAKNASPGNCSESSTPPAGAVCNLYVWHEGVTKFIATLSANDAPDWGGTETHNLTDMTSRVSPDGLWLAFMSDRSLTGYDNRDVVSGVPDEEVYLYSAVSGRLVCASCDPSGARPVGVEYRVHEDGLSTGDRVWPPERWLAANVPGWTPYTLGHSLYQSRYLSDSGRLFFDSNDALVSQDTNGSEDVYEFDPAGVGNCAGSSSMFVGLSDGCVGLISSGLAVGESAFLDASASGGDVLFLTTGKLVPEDVDTALDVYDAHECTVTSSCFVSSGEEVPVCESAASCRVSPSPQPLIYGSPSSATFAGTGNIVEPAVVTLAGKSVKKVVLTRSQKLASALRACKKSKSHKKRIACEKRARKSYAAPHKPVKGK